MLHANGVKDANIALLFPNSQELSRLNSELLKELHHAIEPVQMNPEIVDSAMPAAIVSQLFIKFAVRNAGSRDKNRAVQEVLHGADGVHRAKRRCRMLSG